MGEVLDAAAVRRWCGLAVEALDRARAEIDALNVFPIPDRDTGTNLYLTARAAAEAVAALPDGAGPAEVWRALARGALLGARGSSGAILGQALRGMAEVCGGADAPVGGPALARALRNAAAAARGAVERPVEGTIVTALDAAAAAAGDAGPALPEVARAAADGARRALRRTTGQLEVLAADGVVDAGAAGWCVLLDALAAAITGERPERRAVPAPRRPPDLAPRSAGPRDEAPGRDGPGYEVMYALDAPDEAIGGLRRRLAGLGDSLVVVGGDGLWNVHVHVGDAGAAIEAGLAVGRVHRIRVTCLHAARRPRPPRRGRAVVAVTAADGPAALLEEAGARVVRHEPGAAPSAAALAEAMLAAGDEVAVLPDGPEALAAAGAAAERVRGGGTRVAVLPITEVVQALAALAVHDPSRRFDDDVLAMRRAAEAMRVGRLRFAGGEGAGGGRAGEVLGLVEEEVVASGTDPATVARRVLDRLLDGGGELVTLVVGEDAPDGLAALLQEWLRRERPDAELVVCEGGRPDCPLLIGVE